MLIVTDLQGNTEPLVNYKNVQRKQRVNGEYSLSFPLFKTDNNIHSYPLVIEESLIEYEGQQYRIKKMDEKPIGLSAIKNVLADHIFFDLIDDYQYDLITGYLSIIEALTHALALTDYTWEVLDAFPQYQFENFGDDNCLALVQTILDRYGAEVEIDNKHLVFKAQIGSKTDFQFRFKHNTKTITKSVDTSNLSTYIKGFGANGLVVEYESPMAAVYGIKHAKPVRDERFTTAESLTAHLQEVIQDEPKISFTLDFIDLRNAGYPYDIPKLGDEVYIIYEPLNIDITARILDIDELKDEKGKVIKTAVTLSNFRENATDIMASFSRTQKQVDGILEGKAKLPFSALDEVVKRATEVIKNAETQLEFPDSGWVVARDKEDPNKVVVLNSAGLAISNNNLVDVLIAITGDGIVADRITSGTIDANNINIKNLRIGSTTAFETGYDPITKETPSGAQTKANTAESNAKSVAYTAQNTADSALAQANNSVQKGIKFDSSIMMGNGNGIKVLDNLNALRVMLGQYTPGKYGLKVLDGEIYGTMFQTGTEGSTTYIRMTPNGDFEAVRNGKRVIFMQASAAEGRITLYDSAGNEALYLNASYGYDTSEYGAVRSSSSNDGLFLTTPSGASIRLNNDGSAVINCGSRNLDITAGEVRINGDLYVSGTTW